MGERKIIPQPSLRRSGEQAILNEGSPQLAVVLWQFVRHLRDWIESTPDQRKVLFKAIPPQWVADKRVEAAIGNPLADDLEAIGSVLRSPLDVDQAYLANALERIARWAETEGFGETATHFAELAATLDRDEPRRANLAGRLARDAGEYVRAEVWLERGIGLARRRRDWVEYTRGHLGAGIMCMSLGHDARARRHLNTASTIAMREGHEWLAAEAQHDLFHFMTVRGNYGDAELHARRALAWYPKHHQRIPFFAADVAFLLVSQRHYTAALGPLRRFVRMIKPPHNILGFSVFVRALAGGRKHEDFRRYRLKLLDLINRYSEYEAAARWNLAHAERAAGMWEAARSNARASAELARDQQDTETEQLALELLRQIDAGEPPPDEIPRTDKAFRKTIEALTSRLTEWAPTRRGRSRSRSKADWAA